MIMLLKHYFVSKIAHSSYILAGKSCCAVIDPRRDTEFYIDEARQLGVDITHILETHLHADFVSGHMELAQRTGARIYAPLSGKCRFEHTGVSEGDVIELEDMELRVIETPGHTPEHVSYVVADKSRTTEPLGVFTGDTLFVGDVGRPDLFPEQAKELASKLFHSLHDKLMALPDYCEVYPAHGAGSLCGRDMGAKWRTTIGYERNFNTAIQIKTEKDFIESLTSNMPQAPDHFSRCSDVNRKGPAVSASLPEIAELSPGEFMKQMKSPDAIVLDIRDYDSFGSQHLPGSWNISFNGNFPTFAGWVMPVDKDILLVASDFQQAKEATVWARRSGVDRITGYLEGGIFAWVINGFPTSHVRQLSAEALHNMVTGSDNLTLVDVRSPKEYQDNHIEGAINIPAPDLRSRYSELDRDKTTVLICSTGHRSSLGTSILKQNGFKDIYNVSGGMTGYSKAGHAKQCMVCENPHGSRYFTS